MPLLCPRGAELRGAARRRRMGQVGRWWRWRLGKGERRGEWREQRERKVDFNTAYFIHAYNPALSPAKDFHNNGLVLPPRRGRITCGTCTRALRARDSRASKIRAAILAKVRITLSFSLFLSLSLSPSRPRAIISAHLLASECGESVC